jgi:hypothetical protein
LGLWRRHDLGRRSRFRDVDASFEIRAVFDYDAAGFDVSYQLGFTTDVNLIGGFHIALNGALDNDLAGFETGLHTSVGTYSQPVLMAFYGSLHFPVES